MPRLWRLVGCHGNPSHSFPTQLVSALRLVTGLTSSESDGGLIALFPLKFEECEVIQGDIREKVPSQSLSVRRGKSIIVAGKKGFCCPAFLFYKFTTNGIFKVTAERTSLTTLFRNVLKGPKGTVHSKKQLPFNLPSRSSEPARRVSHGKRLTASVTGRFIFDFLDIHWK